MHYWRWTNWGSLDDRPRQTPIDRFRSHIDTGAPLPKWAPFLGPCWLWTAGKDKGGYGVFHVGSVADGTRRQELAHRFGYEQLVGPIPEGLHLDHLCRVRHCVNPTHLEPVTEVENIRRGQAGRRESSKTLCPQGHPYDEINTYVTTEGYRKCRTCDRERNRRGHARRRDAKARLTLPTP